MARAPTADTGRTPESFAEPSKCTVHAPQALIAEPYFGPVILSSSRKAQRRGVEGSTATSSRLPLTLSRYVVMRHLPRCFFELYAVFCKTIHSVLSLSIWDNRTNEQTGQSRASAAVGNREDAEKTER